LYDQIRTAYGTKVALLQDYNIDVAVITGGATLAASRVFVVLLVSVSLSGFAL